MKVGLNINHASQDLTVALPDQPTGGSTTDTDLLFSWEVIDQGKPTAGKIFAQAEGRWKPGPPESGLPLPRQRDRHGQRLLGL